MPSETGINGENGTKHLTSASVTPVLFLNGINHLTNATFHAYFS